jgi:hypothetical protein
MSSRRSCLSRLVCGTWVRRVATARNTTTALSSGNNPQNKFSQSPSLPGCLHLDGARHICRGVRFIDFVKILSVNYSEVYRKFSESQEETNPRRHRPQSRTTSALVGNRCRSCEQMSMRQMVDWVVYSNLPDQISSKRQSLGVIFLWRRSGNQISLSVFIV